MTVSGTVSRGGRSGDDAAADAALRGTALAVGSVASVQFGAALAARLIDSVGILGSVSLRQASAALVLTLVTRPWRVSWRGADLRATLLFGAVFVGMNLSLYTAISRLPLATAITLEFLGPLVLSLVTAGTWAHRVWALPAGAGVLLLGGGLHADDVLGVAFALAAGVLWATYILLSRRIGRSSSGLAGLTLATAVGAVVLLPVGAVQVGAALWHPAILGAGLVVGVLSSALPYSLDMLALRRLPTAVFSVLTSLNPAVGALAGLLVLHQRLPWPELVGIGLVTVASIGVTLAARRPAGGRRARRAGGSGRATAGATEQRHPDATAQAPVGPTED
ncbi:EamA family transporter [Nakamurella endophytica]|uniref:EamA family transporter n=1 Tax=Nakamurella endophytica TaxID=1748367 RepID=UPI001E454D8D|nr:EamA family transporter [Nakamurella endophytica]